MEYIIDLNQKYKELLLKYQECRNELCLKCGKYKYAHDGACKGCKWENE